MTGTFASRGSQTGFLVRSWLGQPNQLANLRAVHACSCPCFAIVYHGYYLRCHRSRSLACHVPSLFYDQVNLLFLLLLFSTVITCNSYYPGIVNVIKWYEYRSSSRSCRSCCKFISCHWQRYSIGFAWCCRPGNKAKVKWVSVTKQLFDFFFLLKKVCIYLKSDWH